MSKQNDKRRVEVPDLEKNRRVNALAQTNMLTSPTSSSTASEGLQPALNSFDFGLAITPAKMIENFFAVWLPFEIEMVRLTEVTGASSLNTYPAKGIENLPGEDGLSEAERETQQIEMRRVLLEQLFEDAACRYADALNAVQALNNVVHLFLQCRSSMDKGGMLQEKAAGEVSRKVMSQLTGDPEFLRQANAYLSLLHHWLLNSMARPSGVVPTGKTPTRRLAPRTTPVPDILRFFNDAVHAVSVRALARPDEWEPHEGFAYAFQQLYGEANVTIGLPDGESAQSLWDFLRRGGPRMVKAHYALWARYYEDYVEGGPRYVAVSIPQFCADIGLKKHKNGGFRPEQKREAMRMLQAMAAIEMRVEKTLPNGKRRRLRGPLWGRGLEAEEMDAYADLFGAAREGKADNWEPVAFSFAPGPWFDDPEWRRYHQFMGKIGAGLLRLSADTDKWAILIGGYLGTIGRNAAYRPLRLRVSTILRESGLAQSRDACRRVSENRAKFEAALDRLTQSETAVIMQWRFVDTPVSEPDMDDSQALAEYGASETYPPGDWRGWLVEIQLPFQADRERLEAGRAKAKSSKRSSR